MSRSQQSAASRCDQGDEIAPAMAGITYRCPSASLQAPFLDIGTARRARARPRGPMTCAQLGVSRHQGKVDCCFEVVDLELNPA